MSLKYCSHYSAFKVLNPAVDFYTRVLFYFLQVFSEDGSLSHYIDGLSETENWMKFVNCARHGDEQNLALVQDGHQLFYQCCKGILVGEELLVWYGKCYTLSMGIPTGLNVVDVKEDVIPVNELTGKISCVRY